MRTQLLSLLVASSLGCMRAGHAESPELFDAVDGPQNAGSERDARCDVSPPAAAAQAARPLAPLSGVTVSTRRPTLRWQLPPGVARARIEVCRDRACTQLIETFDATGSSARTATDLPAGVVYWRARDAAPRDDPGDEAAARRASSPTWQFTVAPHDAGRDGVWGTALDLNGDGMDELAVGSPSARHRAGRVFVYRGTVVGPAAAPYAALDGSNQERALLGWTVVPAGDVNGDGYVDLLATAPGSGLLAGVAHVYAGSRTGVAVQTRVALPGLDGRGSFFGAAAAGIGDFNGDGYADVAVSAPGSSDNPNAGGRVHVYYGSERGLGMYPGHTIDAPDGLSSGFGVSVAGLGDVNGDGLGDFAVGASTARGRAGRVHVYLGSKTLGATLRAGWVFEGPDGAGAEFGRSVASAGDVNGDGLADVIVGAPATLSDVGRAHVYLGTTAMRPANEPPAASVSVWAGAGAQFGGTVAALGDLDGDGMGEVVISATSGPDSPGRVFVFSGTARGIGEAPRFAIRGYDGAAARLGHAVVAADVDGNGYPDLMLGAFGVEARAGRVYVHMGWRGGLSHAPTFTLLSPEGPLSDFGFSLASRARGAALHGRAIGG